MSLTSSQQQFLEALDSLSRDLGGPPTQTELAKKYGTSSTNGIRYHLKRLSELGMITTAVGKARAMRLTQRGLEEISASVRENTEIPVIGSIAAGPLSEAVSHSQGSVPINPHFFRGSGHYALRVEGESMRDAGILHGDLAILSDEQTVPNGAIAAVIVDGEATLKRVVRKGKTLILKAANPAFIDMILSGKNARDIRLAGRLVGVVRQEVNQ